MGSNCLMDTDFLFGVMGMPDNGNDCIIFWDILETTELYTLVKMMHFMLCEYNLSKKNQKLKNKPTYSWL